MDVEEKLKLFNKKEEDLHNLRKRLMKNSQYLGELKLHPLYNIWRSFRFTNAGKKVGNSNDWNNFLVFYKDVISNYEKNKKFCRKNKNDNWNKDNYIFLTQDEIGKLRQKEHYLTFNGKEKTLREWSILLDIPYNVIVQRYYATKKNKKDVNWILSTTPEYNRRWSENKKINPEKLRITRLISNYNSKDKKGNRGKGDLTVENVHKLLDGAKCIYCGDVHKIGLDRIDNLKAHNIDNCVPCCYECNVARSNNFSHEEMKMIGKTIAIIKQNREFKKQ